MRMPSQALMRYHHSRVYHEEGLGFSIGGFHPFRINDWKKAVKKVDSNVTRALHIDKIPIIGDIHKAVTGAVDRLDSSVNKDFRKVKKWSQDHRKELQIAAALATAAVGGAYAAGWIGGGSTAAEGITTGATIGGETIAPLSTVSTTIAPELLAPATVGTTIGTTAAETAATVAGVAGATGGSSILSATLGVLGTVAKDAGPLLALAKLAGGSQPQDMGTGGVSIIPSDSGYGYSGGSSGGGGGGFVNPYLQQDTGTPSEPAPSKFPVLALVAVLGGAALLMSED